MTTTFSKYFTGSFIHITIAIFIRNFSNMLNSKRGEESHIRLYITKNGSMSLLNIAKMSYPTEGIISHYNSCYSEIEGIDHD